MTTVKQLMNAKRCMLHAGIGISFDVTPSVLLLAHMIEAHKLVCSDELAVHREGFFIGASLQVVLPFSISEQLGAHVLTGDELLQYDCIVATKAAMQVLVFEF